MPSIIFDITCIGGSIDQSFPLRFQNNSKCELSLKPGELCMVNFKALSFRYNVNFDVLVFYYVPEYLLSHLKRLHLNLLQTPVY